MVGDFLVKEWGCSGMAEPIVCAGARPDLNTPPYDVSLENAGIEEWQ